MHVLYMCLKFAHTTPHHKIEKRKWSIKCSNAKEFINTLCFVLLCFVLFNFLLSSNVIHRYCHRALCYPSVLYFIQRISPHFDLNEQRVCVWGVIVMMQCSQSSPMPGIGPIKYKTVWDRSGGTHSVFPHSPRFLDSSLCWTHMVHRNNMLLWWSIRFTIHKFMTIW